MNDKKMYMLIGPTGCGKTTFRKKYLSHVPCLSPDDFIIGKFSYRKRSHAWAHCQLMAVELFLGNEPFAIDSQFIEPALRLEWMQLANGFGFKTVGFAFNTPWKQLRLNQKNRGSRGFYGPIPFKVQRETFRAFQGQLQSMLREKIVAWETWPLVLRMVKWGDPKSLKSALALERLSALV